LIVTVAALQRMQTTIVFFDLSEARFFVEMRDHVGDERFLKRKKLEAQIQEKYPDEWTPLYSMVTFSDLPYSEALRLGKIQKRVMDEFLLKESDEMDFRAIVDRFNTLKKDD
jgi:kynurenine 3-monooxygenase